MKLYPQDLRDRQHATIIKRRSYGASGMGGETANVYFRDVPPRQLGRLGRLWAKRSGLTEQQAATGLPAASMSTLSTLWLGTTLPPIFTGIATLILAKAQGLPPDVAWSIFGASTAALAYLSAVPWAGAAFRYLYRRPLTTNEIDVLLETDQTEVERAYLTLVRDAVRQEVPEAAEAHLRTTIAALGEAIDRLPAVTVVPLDTDALRKEARSLQTEAESQPDRVISDSLERRAEAQLRRVEAHERSALNVRRSAALRAEIQAQIEALREGLAAFSVGGGGEIVDMEHLSESARRVAAEAVSQAAARAELEGGLAGTGAAGYTAAPAEAAEPAVQRVGTR